MKLASFTPVFCTGDDTLSVKSLIVPMTGPLVALSPFFVHGTNVAVFSGFINLDDEVRFP